MLRRIIKKIFLVLSWPIRYSIRYELRKNDYSQDILQVLQRKATESTADYV